MIHRILNWFYQSDAYYWGVGAWICLAPIRPAMACALFLPLCNLVLTFLVAYKTKQPYPWVSIRKAAIKTGLYLSGTILAFVTETYMTGPLVPCIHLVTGLIGVTELRSCLTQLDALNSTPVFSNILTKIVSPGDPPQDPPGA